LSEEQRSQRGCIARRMQPDFHHGLLIFVRQQPMSRSARYLPETNDRPPAVVKFEDQRFEPVKVA
jgi:hypothetical protein